MRRDPEPEPDPDSEPSLVSTSLAPLLPFAAIMNPLWSLPLDPLLLEQPAIAVTAVSSLVMLCILCHAEHV